MCCIPPHLSKIAVLHAKHQPSELVVAHVGSDWSFCGQIAHPCCCGCCLADLWRRLRLVEALPELSLISPSLHAESPSTCWPLSKARFRMSEWSRDASLFLSLLRRRTCTHTQAHMTVDHHLTVAMTTFNSPHHSKTHCRLSKNNVCCLSLQAPLRSAAFWANGGGSEEIKGAE